MLGLAAALSTASLALSFTTVTTAPLSSAHYLLYTITLLLLIRLTPLNFHTARQSSTLILLFWPAYTLVSIVRIRTMIITGELSQHLTQSTSGQLLLARESLWLGERILRLSRLFPRAQ